MLRQHPLGSPDDISPFFGRVNEINKRGYENMKIKTIYLLVSLLALLASAMYQAQASLSIALTINFSISFTLKMNTKLRKQAGLLFCE